MMSEMSQALMQNPEKVLSSYLKNDVVIALVELSDHMDRTEFLLCLAKCLKVHRKIWLYFHDKFVNDEPPFKNLLRKTDYEPEPKRRKTGVFLL